MKSRTHSPRRWAAPRCAARALLWLWLLLPAASLASAADLRLLVDVSASMGQTDPDNLRSQAVGLLLRLLPDDGRAGVWTYGEYVNMLVKHGQSDRLWKETAAIRTSDLASVGRRSNLLEAVQQATWDRSSGGPAQLLLLTDGRLDVADDPAVNAAQRQQLLTELAPELARRGFRIHTLALSDQADFDLLQQLARLTGGYHGRIEAPAALPAGLLAMLGRVADATTLPVTAQGTFRVAPGTRELTLLRLSQGAATPLTLVTSEGRRLNRDSPRDRVRWHLDDGYELVTVADPAGGVWRFEGPVGGARIYAYGDLAIRYLDLPGTVFPGELRSFEFVLVGDGEPVTDADFLDVVQVGARLQGADGTTPLVVERAEAGRFKVNLLGLRGRGEHVLETDVRGPTFGLRLSVPFTLDNPLGLEIHPDDGGLLLWASVGAASLDHSSLRVAALVKKPPAAARLMPLEALPTGLWKLRLPGTRGLVEVTLDLKGNYLNGREFSLRTQPVRIVLPVTGVKYVDMDLEGRPLLLAEPPAEPGAVAAPALTPPGPIATVQALPPAADDPAEALLPLWQVGVAAGINVLLLLLVWWLLGRGRTALADLDPALARLRALAGLEAAPEAAPDGVAAEA